MKALKPTAPDLPHPQRICRIPVVGLDYQVSTRVLVRPVGLDMVEVGGSNPHGPAKFLSLCFYSTLYFQDSAFRRVSACGHYRGKVMTKDCLSLPKLIRGVIARY